MKTIIYILILAIITSCDSSTTPQLQENQSDRFETLNEIALFQTKVVKYLLEQKNLIPNKNKHEPNLIIEKYKQPFISIPEPSKNNPTSGPNKLIIKGLIYRGHFEGHPQIKVDVIFEETENGISTKRLMDQENFDKYAPIYIELLKQNNI